MISSPIDEIKNRLDIVELISNYIKLQKVGANYRAPCPFHSEKKPSFFISPVRQIWHCFGSCGEGGDIFKFIMKVEGVEFGDALRILAQKAGVELKKQDPKLKTERQRLYEIYELSCQFFEKQFESSKVGQTVKKYLLNRGVNEESIKKWRIGYAPDSWQGLSDFLIGKGYKKEEISKSGLGSKNEEGKYYDRFRSRIIFPVFDLSSQVIGFGGRIFGKEKEVAKYVNTPNTLLYDKSRVLYGLNKARLEIRKKDFCILVEGYIDVIMVSQAGFENVVATSGTALTSYQLTILKRYSENLLTSFDMDIAGDAATKKGINLAQAQGFNIKVVVMPEGKDPADIVSENSQDWKKLVNEAREILQFYFETTFLRFDKKTPDGKREISNILLPSIKKIPNKIVQSHWIQKLSNELEVKETDIEEELKKYSVSNQDLSKDISQDSVSENIVKKSRKELLEESILTLILKKPSLLKFIEEDSFDVFSKRTKEILEVFKKDPNKCISEVLAGKFKWENPEIANLLNNLSFKAEIKIKEEDFQKEILNCLNEIKTLEIKNRLDIISQEIKKAELEKDSKKTNNLIEKFKKLSVKLTNL